MQSIPLAQALGGLASIPQFFVWRLTWDADERKYLKAPCRSVHEPWPMDASLPENWMPYSIAAVRLDQMRAEDAAPGRQYALGFYLTEGLGYWFLDFDHCIVNGAYQGVINDWYPQLPGCFFETSSSGDGAHIIGRGTVPTHAKKNKALGTELYTAKRGICFGLSGVAHGSADVGNPAIASIASLHFPPRAEGEDGDFAKARADWAGPADDGELLTRALASKSTAAAFGARATFADLWEGREDVLARFYGPGPGNERDAALASHLAFWTGCDAPRMERLMRQSALYRPKWDEHRTYLRELTITNACAAQKDVYRERGADMYALKPLPLLPLPLLGAAPPAEVVVPRVSEEVKTLIETLLTMVSGSRDVYEIHETVIPAIRAAGIPPALMPRLETAVNKRLELWDSKLPVGKLRALLSAPRGAGADEAVEGEVFKPDWASNYVYVTQGDLFHDLTSGLPLSRTSFGAKHDRDMPIKGDGPDREDAAKWMLQRWDVPLVHDTVYYPGKPPIVDMQGVQWANIYTEASHPVVATEYTAEGYAAIERFSRHLWLLCGQRERVWANLLAFMAHNVQFPGKKIRWVPIIKGTEGDGKTMIGRVMDAALGERNAISVGPEIINNNGGFTDWAHGNAFVALEEMYLTGKDRHKVANAVKQFITNEKVTINPKGGKPKKVPNTSNQCAFTNHSDAIPLEAKRDRRWFVIFTPFDTREDLYKAMGFTTEPEVRAHFDAMFDSLTREPGQWRKWLLEWTIPAWFTANGAAIDTEEKAQMANAGVDDIEQIARQIVEDGAFGVSATVLSSAMLTMAMRQSSFVEGVELPKSTSVHYLLNRMGFVKVAKNLKWEGQTHRVWTRPGVNHDPDTLRGYLSATKAQPVPKS